MKLLDTNVFLYAAGRPHPYKEPCARLLEESSARIGEYAIDTELLQEVLHVYRSRGELARGLTAFDDLIAAFPNPIPIGRVEVVVTRRLLAEYPALSPRDAIHAAVVQAHDLEGIITTDRTFREIRGLAVFDPNDVVPGR
ncbi:MAG: type II toxin-antitoxin system VapC family toxin [Chloroflexota bacterium]|nr:type II toxin-antitoxin system VapC family toxin [Chloroflexota bacterium]